MLTKALRPFIVASFSEILLITIASFGGKRTDPWASLGLVMIWGIAFAIVTGTTVTIMRNFISCVRRPRLTSLLLSILLAVIGYLIFFVVTAGYGTNIQYPVLITFCAGSVSAFVDSFWPSKSTAAAISLAVILTMGFSVTALFWITKRRSRVRVTVVKLAPSAVTDLRITWLGANQPDDFEKHELQRLGLQGEAHITNVYDLGPMQGNPSHTVIVLTQPLIHEVRLAEGDGNLLYFQKDLNWNKFPPDAGVSWRKVEMYQIPSTNCTAVLVWYRLDQQAGSGGPCWSAGSR